MKTTDFFIKVIQISQCWSSGVFVVLSVKLFLEYWPNYGVSHLEFLYCLGLFALALIIALLVVKDIKNTNKNTEPIADNTSLNDLAVNYYLKQRELEETKKKLFALQGNYAQLKRKLETNVSGDEKTPTIIITPTEGK